MRASARIFEDFSQAARTSIRHPRFFVFAALLLSLGIGMSTALFSLMYGVLLKPPAISPARPAACSLEGRLERSRLYRRAIVSGVSRLAVSLKGLRSVGGHAHDCLWILCRSYRLRAAASSGTQHRYRGLLLAPRCPARFRPHIRAGRRSSFRRPSRRLASFALEELLPFGRLDHR